MVSIEFSEESWDFPHRGVSRNIRPAGKIILIHEIALWVTRTEVSKPYVSFMSLHVKLKFGIKKMKPRRASLGHAANYTSRALMLSSHFVPNRGPGGPLLVNCAPSSCSDLAHVPFPSVIRAAFQYQRNHHLSSQLFLSKISLNQHSLVLILLRAVL